MRIATPYRVQLTIPGGISFLSATSFETEFEALGHARRLMGNLSESECSCAAAGFRIDVVRVEVASLQEEST